MVFKCSIPSCTGNYRKGPKVSVFSLPKCVELRKKWLLAIPRKNVKSNKNFKVCELHFQPDDVRHTLECYNPSTGKKVITILSQPRLCDGAIPFLFPDSMKYLFKDKVSREIIMPRRCSVFGCRSNYDGENKSTSTFSLPKDPHLRSVWLKKIPTDFSELKNPVVCSKHFKESCIIRKDKVLYKGVLKEYDRERPKLKEDAVPSIFPSCPAYLNNTSAKAKKQLVNVEDQSFQKAVEGSTENYKNFISDQTLLSSNAGNSASDVPDKAESILPDVPNLAIVKKEPVDDSEEIHPSTSENISSLPSSSTFVPSVKLEFTTSEDCLDDMTIPVNPNDVALLATSTDTLASSSMPFTCADGTEPPPKRPNLSQNPPISSAEIKDEFSIFGSYVADKIRSFTDRHLQVEAQHHIMNLLFEIEMKDLKEDSLPVISKISSLQKPLPTKVKLPSSSATKKISSLQKPLSTKVMHPSSLSISKISSLQIPATVTLPSGSPIRISNLQTFPDRVTLPSSPAVNKIPNLQQQLPATVILPSASSSICSMQTQSPVMVTSPSSLSISEISNLQGTMPATMTLPSSSSSPISKVLSLQVQVPETVALPFNSPISRVSGLQEQKSVIVTLPTSSPISIASNLTELPATMMLPSSSLIPFTSGNTINLNTQVMSDMPK